MKTQVLIFSIALLAANAPVNFTSTEPATKEAKVISVQNADFAMFRIHRQGKTGVAAVWAMTATDGVTGFSVQRTYQDPTDPYSMWEVAGTVACDASRSFKYVDNCGAGQISYRIVAQLADGSTVTSATETIRLLSH